MAARELYARRYFESEMLTPYLLMLIEESSLPLAAIEEDFAVDSSGLSTGVYQRWDDAKWGKVRTEFGDDLRSKTERAQINEALCKILCHNICCLIQSMYELNLTPKFWKEVA